MNIATRRSLRRFSGFTHRRAAGALAGSVAALLSHASASADNFISTASTSGTFNWSSTTSFTDGGVTTSPTSSATTTISYTSTLASAVNLVSNDDLAGNFLLNALNFTAVGPATGTAPTITVKGNTLEFITNGGTGPAILFNTTGTVAPLVTVNSALLLDNTLTLNATNNATISGAITGTGGLIKIGAGVVTLSGSNSFTGAVAVSTGALLLTSASALGASSAIAVGGGTNTASIELSGNTIFGTPSQTLTINGTGINSFGALQAVSGNSTWAGNVVIGSDQARIAVSGTGATLTISGVVSNGSASSHSILMRSSASGVQTVVLSGSNTYDGSTILAQGVLSVGQLNSVSNSVTLGTTHLSASNLGAPTTVANGTILFGNALGATLVATLQYTGTGETSDRNFTISPAGTTNSMAATIDQSGTGTLKLLGTFTGASNSGGAAKFFTLQGNTSALGIFAGVISDGVGAFLPLTKTGLGSWALTGSNTYTGATAVSQGTLILGPGGSLGNTAVTVSPGATLAVQPGTGSYTLGSAALAAKGGSLALPSGSIFSMVDGGIGTFNIVTNGTFATAPLTLSGGTLNLELSSAGTDKILVSGGGTSAFTAGTVNLTALGSSLTLGSTYTLISAAGITAGTGALTFANGSTVEGLTVGTNAYTLTLSAVSGAEQITIGGVTIWTGQTSGTGGADSAWTTATGHFNFANAGAAVDYADGTPIVFQDTNPITGTAVTNANVVIQAAGVAPLTVTVNNNSVSYTFSDDPGGAVGIFGSTGIVKSGVGTLTLASTNTYTGGTVIAGGVLDAGVAGALGTGSITLSGGTLQYGTGNTQDYSSRFSATAGQAYNIDTNGNNVTFAIALTSGNGSLTKLGTGTLTLSGTNTYGGTTTLSAGTVVLTSANGAAGGLGSSLITVNSGTSLIVTAQDGLGFTSNRNPLAILGGSVLNNGTATRVTLINTVNMVGGVLGGTSVGDGTGTYSFDPLANGTVNGFTQTTGVAVNATSDASGNPALISAPVVSLQATTNIFNVTRGVATPASDLTISSSIVNFGGGQNLTKTGNGILTLTNSNTYSGGTTISAGTVIVANGANLGSSAGAVVDNATLIFTPTSNAMSIGNVISGSGTVTMNGTGLLTLTGSSSYSGGITISSGTLTVGTGGNLGASSGAVVDNSALFFTPSNTQTIGNVISGSGTVTINNSGTTSFTASNTFTGALAITAGQLNVTYLGSGLGTSDSLGAQTTTASRTINIGAPSGNDVLNYVGAATTSDRVINLSLTGVVGTNFIRSSGSGTLTLTGGITGGHSFYLDGPTPGIETGVISSGFALNLGSSAGAGNWTLTGSNTYATTTNVNFGILSFNTIQNAGSLVGNSLGIPTAGANSIITLGANGPSTLQFIGTDATAASSNRLITLAGATTALDASGTVPLALSGGVTSTVASGTATLTLTGTGLGSESGAIANNGVSSTTALAKSGSGTWTLSGTSAYTGSTTVSGGTLSVSGSLSGTTAVIANNSGTFLLSAANGVNKVNTAATVTLGSAGTPGTLAIANSAGTVSQDFTTLTLNANSTIDFGTGNTGTFRFTSTASNGFSLGTNTLTVADWTGSVYNSATYTTSTDTDHLLTESQFDPTTLANIHFYADNGGSLGTQIDTGGAQEILFQTVSGTNTYEIVPIPEPSTLYSALLAVGLVGLRERRRFRRLAMGRN